MIHLGYISVLLFLSGFLYLLIRKIYNDSLKEEEWKKNLKKGDPVYLMPDSERRTFHSQDDKWVYLYEGLTDNLQKVHPYRIQPYFEEELYLIINEEYLKHSN